MENNGIFFLINANVLMSLCGMDLTVSEEYLAMEEESLILSMNVCALKELTLKMDGVKKSDALEDKIGMEDNVHANQAIILMEVYAFSASMGKPGTKWPSNAFVDQILDGMVSFVKNMFSVQMGASIEKTYKNAFVLRDHFGMGWPA